MKLVHIHRTAAAAMMAACLYATAPTSWATEGTDSHVQACTDAWDDAPANDVCSVATTSRNATDAAENPGACVLSTVKCILSAIKIKETSFVINFHVDEDSLTLSVDDTDDLDVCIKGNSDYTGGVGDGYDATLKTGCGTDETGSSTALSDGIPATEYFIDEESKLQNPQQDTDSNTQGANVTTQGSSGSSGNTASCSADWQQAPANTYCSADVSAKSGTLWGMTGTFYCQLSTIECSITVTVDTHSEETTTETDYTLTYSEAGPASISPDNLRRATLCVLWDPSSTPSGYKAMLPTAVNSPACSQMESGGYDQHTVENQNLPEV